jgi:hypothetical protein
MAFGMTARRTGGALFGAVIMASSIAGGAVAQSPAAAPACDAVQFGSAIIRCENFYTDFWPIINSKLDALYEEAKATDGGKLVIWDWYPRSEEEIAAFNARFPDITVETQGFEFALSDAIVTAQATGERNSDVVSGTITSMAAMYDQGFWKKVDWTEYGVPAEFMAPWGYSELLPDSFNSPLMQYNATVLPDGTPATLDELNADGVADQVAIAQWNHQNFSGYGMANGTDAMLTLINDLIAKGMIISYDTDSLLSTGEAGAVFGGQLFSDNPDINVAPFSIAPGYAQFSGVNEYATNPAAAALWLLWYAYDPDWITTRLTDPAFSTSSLPYPGLPTATFDQTTGLAKKNQDAFFAIAQDPTTVFETAANRDQYLEVINAAAAPFAQ